MITESGSSQSTADHPLVRVQDNDASPNTGTSSCLSPFETEWTASVRLVHNTIQIKKMDMSYLPKSFSEVKEPRREAISSSSYVQNSAS